MLTRPRFLRLLRQTPLHETLLGTGLRQSSVRRLAKFSKGSGSSSGSSGSQNRGFITSNLRSSIRQRTWQSSRFKGTRSPRRHQSSQTPNSAPSKPRSLSDRMKDMSRKYGWTVTGIYLGLSVLDFPFCFLAVRLFGTERIAEIEHAIVEGFWGLCEKVVPSLKERREQKEALAVEDAAAEAAREAGAEVVQDAKHKDPGLGTQLLLAYGVHKSLIFFRIPLTLAITPKVVKTLRGWGWQIGKAKKAR